MDEDEEKSEVLGFPKHIDIHVNQAIQYLLSDTTKVVNAANAVYTPHISNNKEIEDLYLVCEFLRSYIDYHHDFDDRCNDIIQYIKDVFESIYINSRNSNTLYPNVIHFYHYWLKIIDTPIKGIKSSTGTVIEKNCQNIMEDMIQDFLNIPIIRNAVPWIPSIKSYGKQETFNEDYVKDKILKRLSPSQYEILKKENDTKINKLIKQRLSNDGVEVLVVESTCVSKEMLCLARPKGGDLISEIRLALLDVGKWDAGSGVLASCKTIEFVSTKNDVCTVTNKNQIKIGVDYQIPPIVMFGIAKVTIYNNKTLRVTSTTNKEIYIEIQGPIELSVNSILISIYRSTLRPAARQERIEVIKHILSPELKKLSDSQKNMIVSAYLTLLKTYTDLVQIRFLSSYKPLNIYQKMQQSLQSIPRNIQAGPIKIGMVIYDKLCEITAWLYGLGHVLLTNKDRSVVYNSYDIRSMKPSEESIRLKEKTFKKIYTDIQQKIIQPMVTDFFDRLIIEYTIEKNTTPEPSLYCIHYLAIDSYTNQFEKAKAEISKIYNLDLNAKMDRTFINMILYFETSDDEWIKNQMQINSLHNEYVENYAIFKDSTDKDNISIDDRILKSLHARQLIGSFIDLCNQIKSPIIQSMNKVIKNDNELVKCIGYYILYTYYINYLKEKEPNLHSFGITIVKFIVAIFKHYEYIIKERIPIDEYKILSRKIANIESYRNGMLQNKMIYTRYIGDAISYILPLFQNVKNEPDIYINIVIYMYNLYVYIDATNMIEPIPFNDILNIKLSNFIRIYNIDLPEHEFPELKFNKGVKKSKNNPTAATAATVAIVATAANAMSSNATAANVNPNGMNTVVNPLKKSLKRKRGGSRKLGLHKNFYTKKCKKFDTKKCKKRNQRKHSTRRNTKK
jgi:hypothetical protein